MNRLEASEVEGTMLRLLQKSEMRIPAQFFATSHVQAGMRILVSRS